MTPPNPRSDSPGSASGARAARGLGWGALALVAALLLPLAAWLTRSSGRIGAGEWFLTPHAAWPVGAWLMPLGSLILFGGLAASCLYDRFYRAKTQREGQASLKLALGALALLSVAWNWGVQGPVGINVRQEPRPGVFMVLAASWSDVATEYLGAAYKIDSARGFSGSYAARWQEPRSASIAHVATHPPGATLFYYACRLAVEGIAPLREQLLAASERATGLSRSQLTTELNEMRANAATSGGARETDSPLPESAIATALLSCALLAAAPALAVPALFILGSAGAASGAPEEERRRLEGRGAVAAALWILAPTVGLFAPTLDALVALGAAWALALACKYLSGGKKASLVGAGAVLSLTAFVSFGASTIGLALALWLVLEKRPRDLLLLLAGAVACQAVLLVAFPHNLPLVFSQAMGAHRQATLATRSYASWLALNPVVFALFIGWPVVVGTARGLFLKEESGVTDGLARLKRLALATLGAMLLISLAGSVRGEVERLWMFLLPVFCALAGASWLPLARGPRLSKVASAGVVAMVAVALQAAQTLVMSATLAPLVRP